MFIRKMMMVALLGLSSNVQANTDCEISLDANDMMQFSKKTLMIPTHCKAVTLTLHHIGKMPKNAMGHNVVITETKDIQSVATDGISAGLIHDYVSPNDNRVYAFTKIIGGGESVTISFNTDKFTPNNDYSFFCSFPGHWAIMRGKIEFK